MLPIKGYSKIGHKFAHQKPNKSSNLSMIAAIIKDDIIGL